MRETLQATFAMTDIEYPTDRSSGGVDPQSMAHSATMYGAATVVSIRQPGPCLRVGRMGELVGQGGTTVAIERDDFHGE